MDQNVGGSYLYYRDISDENNLAGIDAKIVGQIKGLNDDGCACRFVFCRQPEGFLGKALSCLPLMPDGIDWPNAEYFRKDNFLYIRRPRFISKELISFLEEVKRINESCKVILEFPNYPYDKEMKIPLLYPALLKDRRNRKNLAGIVDRIAVIKKEKPKKIFGVPSLNFVNGIDFEKVKAKRPVSDLSTINIFFAAYTLKGDSRYGTDRLLEGLAKYYRSNGKRDIKLHFAIGGGAASSIKRQIKRLGLSDRVNFYGEVPWNKLDKITDQCTLAMAPLGLHRIGAKTTSALKTREYLAKGLPFFFSGGIDVFEKKVEDFCLEIPADDSPVNIDNLIIFHDELYRRYSQEELIKKIRNYAKKKVSVDIAMSNIAEYIKENCD